MSSVGDRLRAAREMVEGLSARELDRLAGISEGHTSLIECGSRPRLEAKTAEALARVLGVSLDWLICGEDRKSPSARAVRAAVEAARSKLSSSAA